MKVVHMISGDLWAGAEVQAFTLLRELHKARDIELVAVLMNEGRLTTSLRELDIRVYIVDEQRKNPLRILREVEDTLKAEKGGILHTHRYKENVIGALASRTVGRWKRVQTVHGLPESLTGYKGLKGIVTGALNRFVTRKYFDRVICVSENMMEHLAHPFGREKLRCIRNGIDVSRCVARTPRETVRQQLGVAPEALMIGTAGRLVPVKGVNLLIEAAKLLQPSIPHLTTLIAGDGPEMARLRSRAGKLGIPESVIFTGHRDDVYDLISAMDVFVLPSLSEGIPMVLLEAMALGTPIVATRVGGVPEIVVNGATGLLVDPGDPSRLADACGKIIADAALAHQFKSRARLKVEREHSATVMAQQVQALYSDLVS
jgi:glycosyltransferase involved in cell wall biosynthesis